MYDENVFTQTKAEEIAEEQVELVQQMVNAGPGGNIENLPWMQQHL